MSVDLRLLLEKYGPDFLYAALKHLVGQPAEAVRDTVRYKARVAAASWRAAPMQIRMLSPDQVRWDDFCVALRDRVYSTSPDYSPSGR